jgi:UDP-N-acetylglucosamine transferase subunit ALG13
LIFVTVGAQMPFDRLVRTVDEWAGRGGRRDVFAQIGTTAYRPSSIEWVPFLQPSEFSRRYEAAKVVIAHAGTGSIITALHLGKPILVMPRRASLRETRNDHQVATAEQFRRYASVAVAQDEAELADRLEEIEHLAGIAAAGPYASRQLLRSIRDFIEGADAPLGAADDDEAVVPEQRD